MSLHVNTCTEPSKAPPCCCDFLYDQNPQCVLYLLYVLFWALAQVNWIYARSHCDAPIYGKPDVNNCFELYNQLPGETLSPEINPDIPRAFVEPKFLEPPFTPVPNPYSTQMVQLPKIWRTGRSCQFFLLAVLTLANRYMPMCAHQHC